MMQPEVFDTIALLVDLPEEGLMAGDRGVIIERNSDRTYRVALTDENGETCGFCTLSTQQFAVIWHAKFRRWLLRVQGMMVAG